MNISYNWLKEYIDLGLTPQETADALTSLGLETGSVEKVESIKGGLQGLVIGEVLTCVEHPDSDHLHITTVNLGDGNQPSQIVCGAPNVAAGQHVIVATLGTKLYDGDKAANNEVLGVGKPRAGVFADYEIFKVLFLSCTFVRTSGDDRNGFSFEIMAWKSSSIYIGICRADDVEASYRFVFNPACNPCSGDRPRCAVSMRCRFDLVVHSSRLLSVLKSGLSA